jgi:mycothiol synthase
VIDNAEARAIGLPKPYLIRAATMDDVESATEFFNVCEIDESGVPDYELEEVREEWSDTDLASNLALVVTPADQIVGSMEVRPEAHGSFDAFGYSHPHFRGQGLGTFLVRLSETRAKNGSRKEDSSELILRNWIATQNAEAAGLLSRLGYRQIKRFVRMEITHSSEPHQAPLPAGYEFRGVDIDRDLQQIFTLVDDAFSEHWTGAPRTFESWKKTALGFGFDAGLWSQVSFKGDPVASAIGQNLAGYGWIKWVGVLKHHRGQGIGKALLTDQFSRFWQRGIHTIGLGVDTENTTGALELYEKAGMRVSHSNDAYEKVIALTEDR